MVVVLIFSGQRGDTRCGYAILRSGHHPIVGFVSQNNLCRHLLVGNEPWAVVFFRDSLAALGLARVSGQARGVLISFKKLISTFQV